MKPLVVLVAVFIISVAVTTIFYHDWNYIFAGNAAMGVMLLFTAIGHFKFSKGMAMMMPNFIPYKTALVYLTGFIEIAAAIGLLLPSLRHITALLLIIFFIAILPVNINAAIQHVDHEKASLGGKGPGYLWFRVPLQLFFIAWVWYFSL